MILQGRNIPGVGTNGRGESRRANASRSPRRLYFNESSLRPSLKLSSFQRQYRDHIDSKVIFRIPIPARCLH